MQPFASQTSTVMVRDPALAGLSTLLDTGAFLTRLQSVVPGVAIDSAELVYLRYKPGTNCLARYRLQSDRGPVEIHAKAYGPDAREKIAKDRRRAAVPGPLDRGRWVFPEEKIVVSTFPNDAKLPSLLRLVDGACRDRLIRRVIGLPDAGQPLHASYSALAYKPERRFVARVAWSDHDHAVVKFLTRNEYKGVQRTATILSRNGCFLTPTLIGRSDKHRALAFRWRPGRGLREFIASPNGALNEVAAAGAALASFHRRSAKLPTRPGRNIAARLSALTEQIAILLPDLAAPMAALTRRATVWWRRQDESLGVVHGDFYDKQVIVSDDGVRILDIDSVERGHPVRDLGLFIAHLERDAIGELIDPHAVAPLVEALVRGYCSGGIAVDDQMLRGYTALGLLQLVHHPFRTYRPEWPRRTAQILARADALLDRASSPINDIRRTATCR